MDRRASEILPIINCSVCYFIFLPQNHLRVLNSIISRVERGGLMGFDDDEKNIWRSVLTNFFDFVFGRETNFTKNLAFSLKRYDIIERIFN